MDYDWKLFFWKYDWKVFQKSHLNILPSTSEAHHWQPPVRAERNQLFVRIIFNHLPQSFSIIFHNYFQLFVRIDFNHLSELFSIICGNYLQLLVRFNWFQPFLQIISRTPGIVMGNNPLSLVWFKWGSQWWGILKHFPQSRCILISHWSREKKQSSFII